MYCSFVCWQIAFILNIRFRSAATRCLVPVVGEKDSFVPVVDEKIASFQWWMRKIASFQW
jgi:hypothetical protein